MPQSFGQLGAALQLELTNFRARIASLAVDEPSFRHGIDDELLRDEKANDARQKLLALTDELHCLLLEPAQLLASSTNPAVSVNAIARLGLVKAFEKTGEGAQVEVIASAAGQSVELTRRLMKHASMHYVFEETTPDFYGHTAASRVLVCEKDCQKWLQNGADDIVNASFKIPDAIERWKYDGEPGHSGWNVANENHLPVFQALANSPQRLENFAGAMRWFSKLPVFDVKHLFDVYPWSKEQHHLLVDVAGSSGHVSRYLAERVSGLRCIVQDRQEVIESALHNSALRAQNDLLGDRIKLIAHDLFTPQPIEMKEADVFLLRLILHDWSSEYVVKIVRALIPGLKHGAKVIVNEMILPDHSSGVPAFHQRLLRGQDILMLGLQNGQEREADEFRALFERADPRFSLTNIWRSPQTIFGALEFTWRGE